MAKALSVNNTEGKVVILNRGPALMANMLVSILKESGIGASMISPNIEEIRQENDEADVYIIFAGEGMSTKQEEMVFLKDLCFSENKPIFILGYKKEIEDLEEIIPKKMVMKEFLRPADFKNISLYLTSVINTSVAHKERKHLLLVDDDATFLQTLQSWFGEMYEVTATISGMQAITWLATHRPDLILLDYDMPITPGPQVLEMIRSENNSANIPVIFLTGRDDRESVEKVMALRPDGYLLKSLPRAEIMASIENFFNKTKWENLYKG
ncbi:MAG: response regulator [Firmicutes bacterium]|nr:response regulator [Bacillota bacterium]